MDLNEVLLQIKQQGITRLPHKYDLIKEIRILLQIGMAKKKSFSIDADNQFVFENLIRWANADANFMAIDSITKKTIEGDVTKGIYLCGPTGTGKSWATEILSCYVGINSIFFETGGRAQYMGFSNVRTDRVCEQFSNTGEWEEWAERPIVCFQDLGDEPKESLFMGNREQVMKRIISSRGDKKNVITLFTSNVPLEKTKDVYGDRVYSRLNEMCNYFEIKGKDRRIK